jgi:hypothetical protein
MTHPNSPSRSVAWSASLLRRDLNARAHQFAHERKLLHEIAPGPHQDTDPLIIFGRSELGPHGNFHPASDLAISANPAWLRRLAKPHTASRRSPARNDWPWRELDSAVSSDALLMNIFCHPRVFNGRTLAPAVANLLNVDRTAQPRFGINPGVPLRTTRKGRTTRNARTSENPGAPEPALSSSKGLDSETWVLEAPPPPSPATTNTLTDRTEIDLRLDNLFLEAKLTESNFQTAPPRLIERYRDLETVFDPDRLPRKILYTPASHPPVEDYSQLEEPTQSLTPSQPTSKSSRTVIDAYQLIRNVLAAYAADAAFCVLCDARRHDLIETWYSILSAVHHPTFTTRLKLLTWQELATALPKDLQQFLEAKYGILPTNHHYSGKTSEVRS